MRRCIEAQKATCSRIKQALKEPRAEAASGGQQE